MQGDDEIALAFVRARSEGRALPTYPGRVPSDLNGAYAIQSRAIGLNGKRVVGWKVGKINAPHDVEFGAERLAGPIFSACQAASELAMPVFAEGFAAAEAEFLLRIGSAPDPAKTKYSFGEVTALIDAVHVGLEIASSPFPGINECGPLVTISDFGNNHGIVVGAAIANWKSLDFVNWQVRLTIDGDQAGAATAATMLDGPIGAARFLFESMAARGIALRSGQWISSGAVTGVHPVRVGQTIRATFDDDMAVSCTIDAAVPKEDILEATEERSSG